MPRHTLAVGLALCCLMSPERVLAQTVPADDEKGDVLAVTGQVDVITSIGVGGGGGLEWLHPVSPRWGLTLGVSSFAYPDTQWTYGKVGGYSFLYEDKTLLSADARVGGGRQPTDTFTYQIYAAELTQAVIAKRLYVIAQEQYFHVARIEENLVTAGLLGYPVPSLAVRLNYHLSTGGNVASRFLSGRLDWSLQHWTLLAGFLVGRTTPERFNVITPAPRAVQTDEAFVGVSVPLGAQELTAVVDVSSQSVVRRYELLLGWKIRF